MVMISTYTGIPFQSKNGLALPNSFLEDAKDHELHKAYLL
jgi:hypothetical protein